jgi:hypothetical protein
MKKLERSEMKNLKDKFVIIIIPTYNIPQSLNKQPHL